ncbi:MAG: glycosyltransferase [Anaerolineae bacterium]|nr:glycosyltransferase [Anaerolineae bacterium]MDW8100541.1 glycosyltransferase [Anaerolineae bacterium]
MISVIVYGRNDSYSYNLHKRAAISLNCIAEVLTHPNDEIIFVDCNTPDNTPTFPEAIQDTLTSRAKKLLRILRIRPALYEKYKRNTHLKVLEPLCRNVAIRRSNPTNRWILSTNTDMVFVPRIIGQSLSDIVMQLPDGFYELPRFEVPEALWETVDRTDPLSIIEAFRQWGRSLHLNEVIVSEPHIRYDGPGDFQLMLRQQIFDIHGFNEEMTLGWHVDSNLCKRMYLLNGKTDSLLDYVFAYHCDHTRQATPMHSSDHTENDTKRYVYDVTTPYLIEQAETWGLPNEVIEEIRLTDDYVKRFVKVLEKLLPGLSTPFVEDIFASGTFNHGLLYDNLHALPFLGNYLINLPSNADIGYFGGNVELLRLIGEFRNKLGNTGIILFDNNLLDLANPNGLPSLPEKCISAERQHIFKQSSVFVFDIAMMSFPSSINEIGVKIPERSDIVVNYARQFLDTFIACAKSEKDRIETYKALPREFLIIGSQGTWFESVTRQILEIVYSVYSTRIRHGYIRSDAFTKPITNLQIYTLLWDDSWQSRCEWLTHELGRPVSKDEYLEAINHVYYFLNTILTNYTENLDILSQVIAQAFLNIRSIDVVLALLRLEMQFNEINGQNQLKENYQKVINLLEDMAQLRERNHKGIIHKTRIAVEKLTYTSKDQIEQISHFDTKSINSSPKTSVIWHAPIFDPSGYADEARQFIIGLDSIGLQIKAIPINWSDKIAKLSITEECRLKRLINMPIISSRDKIISVFHIFPTYFRRIPDAAYHIGRTMFETDRIPDNWVIACNQMDEVWVPSDFNIESFARSGVKRDKLVKIPGSVEVNRYRLDTSPLLIKGRRGFNFLSVFDWSLRKGWDVLLRAFLEEFKPEEDVALILKVWSSYGQTLDQIRDEALSYLRLMGLTDKLQDNIIFFEANLSTESLAGLYRAADAFVLPTRGEGWGRPFMEAMLMQLPVIGTRWSGHLEFMNDDNAYLVDCEIVDVPESAWREAPIFQGHRWAEPSVDHLRQLMRQVFEDRQSARQKGQTAREHIILHFNRELVARQIKERLEIITANHLRNVTHRSSVISHPLVVVWEGSQFVYHSLALVNRELCLRLIDAGHEVSIIPYEPDQFRPEADSRYYKLALRVRAPLSRPVDVHVRHQWPPNLTPPPEGHWVIIQPWEFGSLPKSWIEVMSTQVDEIWVPSSYVRDCYVRSGVPADRVFVVPNGVDTTKFRPDVPPLQLQTKKRFKFLFVGGTITRKGIDILLDAYSNAFTAEDDVCLVIKDMGGQSFYKGQTAQELIIRYRARPNAPEIEYIDRTLSDEELAGLYTACDCLVHPYRGEGFGLPIAEAMASGLPVIVTGYGAALDFCDEQTAYLIPAREVRWPQKRVGEWETVDYPWWAEPDREALKQWMRHVVANPAEAQAKGQAARAYIQAHFTWEQAAATVQKRIEALRHQPIQRSAPRSQLGAAQEAISQILAPGQAALERGDLETAAREFAQVTQRYPDLAAGHTALGSTLMALGHPREAIPALRRAVELVPQAASLQNQLGVALYQTGDLAGAEAAFQAARQADPNDVPAALNLIDLYRTIGDYAQATAVIKDALRSHPDHVEVLAAFGTLCAELGDGEGVEMALRHIQVRDPHHPAITSLQQALLASDEGEESPGHLPDAERSALAVPARPNGSRSLLDISTQRGLAFLAQGDLAEAEEAFRRVIEKEPQNADALCNLAEVLRTQGRYDEASTLFLQALRLDPHNVGAILGMATLSSDLGDAESARFFYRQAKIRYPELAELLDPLLEQDTNESTGTHAGFTVAH